MKSGANRLFSLCPRYWLDDSFANRYRDAAFYPGQLSNVSNSPADINIETVLQKLKRALKRVLFG